MAKIPTPPLRCAFFLSDLDGGGAQRTIINIIQALPADRVAATLIVGRGDGPARAWLKPDWPFVDLGCRRVRNTLWPLRTFLAAKRPDVLLATMIDANIVAALAGRTISPRPALVLRETNSHRARGDVGRLRRKAVKWAYARADRMLALSSGVGRELAADYRLERGRICTIHNPVDVSAWRAQAQQARREAPPWGAFGGDGPVLIGVGRLIRQKGFDLLLRAAARCEGRGREAHIVLLGEGPDRAALAALAQQLGLADRILMPGFIADPSPWYAHADAFVLSSRWEGFGHVAVEAMACGLPVIAFDCPYGPSDIFVDRQGGVLVPAEDVNALARAIDELLGDPSGRAGMSRAGQAAAERFMPSRIAADYARLIEDAALEHDPAKWTPIFGKREFEPS